MVKIRDIRVFRPVPSRKADSAELSPQTCLLALVVPTPGKQQEVRYRGGATTALPTPLPAGNAAREAFGLPHSGSALAAAFRTGDVRGAQ